MLTLWKQLERAAALRGNEPAISCGETTLSWREARNHAARIARVLRDQGCEDGSRVALISPNSLTYFLMPFAAECAGAIFVPLNSRLALPEIVEQLEDCEPALLLAAAPFLDIAREASELTGTKLLVVEAHGSAPTSLDTLAQDAEPLPPGARTTDETVAIYYTGGSTGRSKGVILSADGLILNSLQWIQAVSAVADEHLLVIAPMFHMVAGLNCIIAATLACKITIMAKFTPGETLEIIDQKGVTNIGVVPAMIDMMLDVDGFERFDLSSLQVLTYGGAPIPPRTLKRTLDNFAGTRLYQIYGQTEGGPTISVLPAEWHALEGPRAAKLRSAGLPVTLVQIQTVRPDGTSCDVGETGEIVVQGPSISSGYWKRPEETAAAFREDGLHTGDAGYIDEDGFLFIVDRIKDMIVSGGENVYAAEVERVFLANSAVQQCAVIGVPSRKWGESVHAVISLAPGCSVEAEELIDYCRQHLSAYKSARSISFVDGPLPLTPANKIDKRALREKFAVEERD